jgi:SAM-dependent methyltransferase
MSTTEDQLSADSRNAPQAVRVNTPCRICHSVGKRLFFSARERQFGMGDEFTYFECGGCHSLCIDDIPTQLSEYYPSNYYSFDSNIDQSPSEIGWFRRKLRARRALFNIYGSDGFGALIQRMGSDYFPYPWKWFQATNSRPSSKILDIGCGGGSLLRALRDQGFTNLFGVDPFISESILEPYLQITKGEVFDLEASYDLVMLHHSLEHVPAPEDHLRAAASLCAPGGHVLVRVPVAGGYGWRTYGEYWFPLDAPRHLAIPTPQSLISMGERCNLQLMQMGYDSKGFCLWASELYKRGLPSIRPDGRETIVADCPFSKDEMQSFEKKAKEINEANDGDLAFFVFRKPA